MMLLHPFFLYEDHVENIEYIIPSDYIVSVKMSLNVLSNPHYQNYEKMLV